MYAVCSHSRFQFTAIKERFIALISSFPDNFKVFWRHLIILSWYLSITQHSLLFIFIINVPHLCIIWRFAITSMHQTYIVFLEDVFENISIFTSENLWSFAFTTAMLLLFLQLLYVIWSHSVWYCLLKPAMQYENSVDMAIKIVNEIT